MVVNSWRENNSFLSFFSQTKNRPCRTVSCAYTILGRFVIFVVSIVSILRISGVIAIVTVGVSFVINIHIIIRVGVIRIISGAVFRVLCVVGVIIAFVFALIHDGFLFKKNFVLSARFTRLAYPYNHRIIRSTR